MDAMAEARRAAYNASSLIRDLRVQLFFALASARTCWAKTASRAVPLSRPVINDRFDERGQAEV